MLRDLAALLHSTVLLLGSPPLPRGLHPWSPTAEGAGSAADAEAVHASVDDEFRHLIVGPIASVANGYETWFMAPDGSKLGWDTSDRGDEARAAHHAGCRALACDRGAAPLSGALGAACERHARAQSGGDHAGFHGGVSTCGDDACSIPYSFPSGHARSVRPHPLRVCFSGRVAP